MVHLRGELLSNLRETKPASMAFILNCANSFFVYRMSIGDSQEVINSCTLQSVFRVIGISMVTHSPFLIVRTMLCCCAWCRRLRAWCSTTDKPSVDGFAASSSISSGSSAQRTPWSIRVMPSKLRASLIFCAGPSSPACATVRKPWLMAS